MKLQFNNQAFQEVEKAGYANICEIGKERIRRAGQKILTRSHGDTENPQNLRVSV